MSHEKMQKLGLKGCRHSYEGCMRSTLFSCQAARGIACMEYFDHSDGGKQLC